MMHTVHEIHADGGEQVVIRDVVDGRHLDCVTPMQRVHEVAFPEHPFARDAIAVDARARSRRPGLVVHQWYVTVDGQPAGILLFDTNQVRRVAPLHFIAVSEELRDVRLGGARIGDWSMSMMLDAVVPEGADLGCVAETPPYTLKIFLKSGWLQIGADYLEPIHGWDWPTLGLDTRSLALAWQPPPVVDLDVTVEEVAHRAAAAFLLDMYRLPPDLAWVAQQTGDQRLIDGPERR
jgi:hypothetical protein